MTPILAGLLMILSLKIKTLRIHQMLQSKQRDGLYSAVLASTARQAPTSVVIQDTTPEAQGPSLSCVRDWVKLLSSQQQQPTLIALLKSDVAQCRDFLRELGNPDSVIFSYPKTLKFGFQIAREIASDDLTGFETALVSQFDMNRIKVGQSPDLVSELVASFDLLLQLSQSPEYRKEVESAALDWFLAQKTFGPTESQEILPWVERLAAQATPKDFRNVTTELRNRADEGELCGFSHLLEYIKQACTIGAIADQAVTTLREIASWSDRASVTEPARKVDISAVLFAGLTAVFATLAIEIVALKYFDTQLPWLMRPVIVAELGFLFVKTKQRILDSEERPKREPLPLAVQSISEIAEDALNAIGR